MTCSVCNKKMISWRACFQANLFQVFHKLRLSTFFFFLATLVFFLCFKVSRPIQLVFLNILHCFHQTKHRDTQNKSKPVSNQSVKKKKIHNFLHFWIFNFIHLCIYLHIFLTLLLWKVVGYLHLVGIFIR